MSTHAPIQAGKELAKTIDPSHIERASLRVHPNVLVTAGIKAPATPSQARFSTAYCGALALLGHSCGEEDFSPRTVNDPKLQALAARIDVLGDDGQAPQTALLSIALQDGTQTSHLAQNPLGQPGNPMSEADLEGKFYSLVAPFYTEQRATELLDTLRHIQAPDAIRQLSSLVSERHLP